MDSTPFASLSLCHALQLTTRVQYVSSIAPSIERPRDTRNSELHVTELVTQRHAARGARRWRLFRTSLTRTTAHRPTVSRAFTLCRAPSLGGPRFGGDRDRSRSPTLRDRDQVAHRRVHKIGIREPKAPGSSSTNATKAWSFEKTSSAVPMAAVLGANGAMSLLKNAKSLSGHHHSTPMVLPRYL